MITLHEGTGASFKKIWTTEGAFVTSHQANGENHHTKLRAVGGAEGKTRELPYKNVVNFPLPRATQSNPFPCITGHISLFGQGSYL